MNGEFNHAAENRSVRALAALAQPSRLRVFRLLVGAGADGMYPGVISATLDIPANALSFHLRELLGSGLINQQREGRFLRYRADMEAMGQLMVFLTAHCCHGKPCAGMPQPEYQTEAA